VRITAGLAITLSLAIILPAITQEAIATDPRSIAVTLSAVASGLSSPVAVAAPNDGTNRLFILEQAGRIRVWVPGHGLLATPYMDIRSRVLSGGERGLLGLAFHPSFSSNGYFFVYYTDSNGDNRLSRFKASPKANTASAATEVIFMTIPHPTYANHNGGQLQFWNGSLYIGTGDGGGAGDPSGNAQSLTTWLGKILRINVNRTCGSLHYCVLSTNPYATSSTAKHEIWEYGLRNPWRFSFDSGSGALFIGDVGQSDREEIDGIGGGRAGLNLGWDCREGTLDTVAQYGGSYCSGKTFIYPVHQYDHSNGRCAVIGGYVYHGKTYASLMNGIYVYGDYCSGEIWGMMRTSSGWLVGFLGHRSSQITSFGVGANGEMYMVDTSGTLWHVGARHR
jgi:glucose/arabinose dehydrogenase